MGQFIKKISRIAAVTLMAVAFLGISSCKVDSDDDSSSGADKTPPKKITELNVQAGVDKAVLSWTNPSDKDFAGVEISCDPAEGSCKGKILVLAPESTCTVYGLSENKTYKFTLRACDKNSNYSDAVEQSVTTTAADSGDTTPPAEVTDAAVKFKNDVLTITWADPADEDLLGVEISCNFEETSRSLTLDKDAVLVAKGTKKYVYTSIKKTGDYEFVLKTVDVNGNKSEGVTVKETVEVAPAEDVAPTFASRTEALDFIFGTDQLATTKITIKRSEWNTMCTNYDNNTKNETCVHADYEFEKGDKKWKLDDVGIRIRGNTSRIRPQNEESGKYVQAHYKIDFEEWPITLNGKETELDRKMAGVMKGVILKRFKDDGTYSREIFGYNYFRECGVWIAPRAGYTRLIADIVEEDGTVEKVDFGVYEMIENPDKQLLKERTKKQNGGKLEDNTGNLWKCTWKSTGKPDLSNEYSDGTFGVEYVDLNDNSLTSEYSYDLKTNKDKLPQAKAAFKKWINELNALNGEEPEEIKAWYEANVAVDQLLRAYAVNVILGMWDDYWINNNNYYFYFDVNGKAYFIPYDYDNILGTNGCSVDGAKQNPLNWGEMDYNKEKKPLMQFLLQVPEYMDKFKEYLIQFSNEESGFDYANASAKISAWQSMIADYIGATEYSEGDCKLEWHNTYSSFEDHPAGWSEPYFDYKLLSGAEDTNFFKVRQKVIEGCVNPKECHIRFVPGDGGTVGYLVNGDYKDISTVDITFTSGDTWGTIYERINENIYVSGAPGKFFHCWMYKDTEVHDATTFYSDVTLKAHWVNLVNVKFNSNGGSYDGENDYITYSNIPEYTNICCLNFDTLTPPAGDVLGGWTYTKDDEDFVTSLRCEESEITVYAKWIKPLYTVTEDDKYMFTFRPEDFNRSFSNNDRAYLMCDGSNWVVNSSYEMYRDPVTGWYSITVSSIGNWYGFKFYVNDSWYGFKEFKYYLSSDYAQYDEDQNFYVKELKNN